MRAAAAMVLFALACGGRDDLDGRRTPVRGLPETGVAWQMPLGDRNVVWDLYDNRPAAGVYLEEALHIDCTSPDFAKYAEGSYRSHWHRGDEGALVDGLAGELYFPIDRDAGDIYRNKEGAIRIAFYARAATDDQLVSVFLNENRLRDVSMPGTKWSWYAVEAPASAVVDGENKLRFYFRHAGEVDGVRTAATFARFAIGGRRPVPGKTLTSPLTAGDVRLAAGHLPALTVERAGRLSFYVRVPREAPALVLAAAGEGIEVSVAVDGAVRWNGTAAADWSAVTVDLTPEAGHYARIDLIGEGAVHWGRPVLTTTSPKQAPKQSKKTLPNHVIVWTVSSLRADRIHERTTPAFARLAREGVHFRGLVAASPSPGPSHAALLTGRYPSSSGLSEGTVTLGERFRSAGFATAMISGNGFINDDAGYAQGFDEYINPMRRRRPHAARILWRHAKRFLNRNSGGRTFLYVATVEPHLPYTPSEPSLAVHWGGTPQRFEPAKTAEVSAAIRAGTERPTADERAWLTALYDAEVRDADSAFGTVLADLVELGIADQTAIVLVGDHGEELFERGNIGHGETLFQEALATPLVVWFPAAIEPRTVETPVDAVDVYSTVLELAGIGANPEAQGASLLPVSAAEDAPAFSHLPGHGRSMVAGRYKLVVPRAGSHQLYNLVDDPLERTNLMGSLPNVERYLRNLFGLRVGYEAAWQRRRWGSAANLTAAFAEDHGI